MTQEEVIDKVLAPEALRRLPNSPVVDVRWHPYVDTMGEDALEVMVVLDDSLTDKDLKWERVAPVNRAIRDGLLAAGVRLFPYIRWARQTELDDLGIDY